MEKLLLKDISLSFNRKRGRFSVSVGDNSYEQTVCEFLLTVSFLIGKDVEEYLLNPDSEYDTVRIPLTGCGKTVTLTLADFISFREAYSHQMFCLKLEDLLMRQGILIP